MDLDCIVRNGVVVTASDTGRYDIGIKDGLIALLAPTGALQASSAKTYIIDAEGALVTPGGVDGHVHLDEPPTVGKGRNADDFATGTRSAIAGGTTTIVAFAPQTSPTSIVDAVEDAQNRARDKAYCDYALHAIVSQPTPEALDSLGLLRERGVSSIKIYMTYRALQLRDDQILDVLLRARQHGITTLVHAENGDVLTWMTEQLESRGMVDPKYHATSRPRMLEDEATNRAIMLSRLISTPILIVHVSSPEAAETIRKARARGLPVHGETCPQYLFLTRHALDKPGFEGARAVCSPPPRDSPEDLEAIWLHLRTGTFTIFSSDHCPFRWDDAETGKKTAIDETRKDKEPHGRFSCIPNGIPGVETRLPLLFDSGRLHPEKFVELTSTNPAKLYGLYPRKGALIPGLSDADLTIWYPQDKARRFTLTNSDLHHDVDYTPYEGHSMCQWPRYTLVRGEVVWDRDGGGIVGRQGYGQFIKRDRSAFFDEKLSETQWDASTF